MEDAEYTQFCYRWAEEECNENVRLFHERLRDTDPNGLEPGHVAKHHDEWYEKLEEDVESVIDAVDEFCADFGQTLGLYRVKAWKETSKLCFKEFKEHRKAWWVLVHLWANGSVPPVPQPTPVFR